MAAPILYPANILETGTVTVSGAAAGKPKERLFDRDIGLLWEDSAVTGTRFIKVDQGATGAKILKRWQVAAGHNLAGVALALRWSTDDAAYTTDDSVTPSDGSAIDRAVTQATARRFWKLEMPTPATAPKVAEFILAPTALTLLSGPLHDLTHGLVGNVIEQESRGGFVWLARRGAARWVADYLFRGLSATDKTALEAAWADATEGAKAFFLRDADALLRWVQWQEFELRFAGIGVSLWDVRLRFREVL